MIVDTSIGWKIVDIKSASELDPLIRTKMLHDPQVNLYAHHFRLFADKLALDPDKFLGFEYREIEKPKERLKKSENRDELINRMMPDVRFTLFSAQDMHMEPVIQNMNAKLSRMRELFSGEKPTENRQMCVNKGTTCPFFSKCNDGKTYTQLKLEQGV
jgi:hypothetical protein